MKPLVDGFRRVFLGSGATFRNAHRTWLYLGFLVLIVAVFAWRGLAAS